MAYSVPIELKCVKCHASKATEEVFNRLNESQGKFCKKCAKKRVAELEASRM